MKGNKEAKISYWAAHLTTVVSVSLVLIIIGIMALSSIGASVETRRLKEKVEVSVVMADSVTDDRANQVCARLASQPFVLEPRVITSREALEQWTADTGENLEELFGINPLSPEIVFRLRAGYTSAKGMASVAASLKAIPGVAEVALPDTAMLEAMNSNIERLTLILGAIALAMLVISLVLINNTVHLAVYARRFTIHTMQLVGATDGFIRRPYVLNNLMTGMISGIVASGVLAALLGLSGRGGVDLASVVGWQAFGLVALGLTVAGALICGTAAWLATGKYLHKEYSQLFR